MRKLAIAPLICMILVSLISISFAAEPSSKAKSIMVDISRNLRDLPDLSKVTGDLSKSRDTQHHENVKRWVNRDLKKLIAIDPGLSDSSYQVWGVPFSKRLADGQVLIARNDTLLSKAPNKEVLSKIENALFSCMAGKKQLKKANPKMDELEYFYDDYSKSKKSAAAIDAGILDYKKAELADCEKNFVTPYLTLKKSTDAQKRKADQRKAQEEEKARVAAKKKADEDHQFFMAAAKELGFTNGYFLGIRLLLNEITSTGYTQSELKNMMIVADKMDGYFSLASLTEEYAIYTYSFGSDFAQIALIRKPGKAYLQDSDLPDTVFGYAGLEEFTNRLGGRVQLVVLRQVR
ncbi:hypothetical protein [Maridesulfovibrio sp.]|uniref:hypothetical protein n=1 Tax=Maridesulfovibrio sp. TaxID=2795000 RepID=UPI0029F59187|nr:hypothetical protein [Maridesulfovibrio sp.]